MSAAAADPNALMLRGTCRRTPNGVSSASSVRARCASAGAPSARSPARANGRLSGWASSSVSSGRRDGLGIVGQRAGDLAAHRRRRAVEQRLRHRHDHGGRQVAESCRDPEPGGGIRLGGEVGHRLAQLVRRCVARAHPERERGASHRRRAGRYAGGGAPGRARRVARPAPARRHLAPPHHRATAGAGGSPARRLRVESPNSVRPRSTTAAEGW